MLLKERGYDQHGQQPITRNDVGVDHKELRSRPRSQGHITQSSGQEHVVLDKMEDRAKIFEETPLFMNSRMIIVIPWDPSFDLQATCTTSTPVWVDLRTLNCVFEDDVEDLFGLFRELVYSTTKYNMRK